MEGGNTLEDTLEYLQYFEKEVDVFDVSCGLNGSIQYQIDANYLPDGWRSYMAKAVKEKYGKPCMTVGNIRDPKVAAVSYTHLDVYKRQFRDKIRRTCFYHKRTQNHHDQKYHSDSFKRNRRIRFFNDDRNDRRYNDRTESIYLSLIHI